MDNNKNAPHYGEAQSNHNLTITENIKTDKEMASQFLKNLNAENDEFTFLLLDEKNKISGPVCLNGSFEKLYPTLLEYNLKGYGIFVTINKTNLKGRKKEDILSIRGVFVDLDGASLEPIYQTPLDPHFIIETSPKRYHVYWLCQDLSLENFEKVQSDLAVQYNGDPSVKDLPRTMRLPGFLHNKRNPFLVNILQNSIHPPYQADEILENFQIKLKQDAQKNQTSDGNMLKALEEKGIYVKPSSKPNLYKFECPNAAEHTKEPNTAYYSADWNSFWCFHQHCQHLTSDDFKRMLGLSDWSELLPLPDMQSSVLPITDDMLPEILRKWIFDIAERMQAPPDYIAVTIVVIISALIGRKTAVFPKKNDDWKVIPNLWGMLIGRPSLLKTPCMQHGLKILDQMELQNKKIYEEELMQFEVNNILKKAEKASLEDALKRAYSNDDQDSISEIKGKLLEVSDSLKEKPIFKRLKTTDVTVEKLGELLLDNPNGLLLVRDELIGFLKSFDKNGYECARAFYLEAWDGNSSFVVDRIQRGTQHIPAVCLSILGCIPPGPLSSYIYNACKENIGDDGLIQRFQLAVWPDLKKKWENIDKSPDSESKEIICSLLKKISDLPCDNILDPPGIHFDEEAQKAFDSWHCSLEQDLRSGKWEAYLESHFAKYRSLVPSLALIFQYVLSLSNSQGTDPSHVSLEAVQMSIKWSEYLKSHAERIYSSKKNHSVDSANSLLKKIKAGLLKNGSTIREIYSHHWSNLSSSEEVKTGLEVLEMHGYIKIEKKSSIGRPTETIIINPIMFENI